MIECVNILQVRQMFDERRQRVTGIDKSYPLQPISSKIVSNNASRQAKNTVIVQKYLYIHILRNVCIDR